MGRLAILAGTTTLAAVLLLLRQWWAAVPAPLGEVLPEGLLILAWVALWRPIETIGCDSWEGRQQRGVRCLSAPWHGRLDRHLPLLSIP